MIPEYLEWNDSSSEGGPWVAPSDLDSKAMRCYSVGYVAREDEHTLTIAQSYTLKDTGDVEEWGHALTIPKSSITSRRVAPSGQFVFGDDVIPLVGQGKTL